VDASDEQPIQQLKIDNQQVVVTDYSLAHWIAQTYNLDIHNMPLTRPSHLTPHTFDELKIILRDYFVSRDKAPSQAELAIQMHLNKLIQKEREKDSSCND